MALPTLARSLVLLARTVTRNICNDVLVITSAPLEVVQRAVSKLNADKVGEPGPTVSARVAAHAGLTLARDERVVSLWWD